MSKQFGDLERPTLMVLCSMGWEIRREKHWSDRGGEVHKYSKDHGEEHFVHVCVLGVCFRLISFTGSRPQPT